MGQVQRRKRLGREMRGKARAKVMLVPMRELAAGFQALGGAFQRLSYGVNRASETIRQRGVA